jgi:hypothetical protein
MVKILIITLSAVALLGSILLILSFTSRRIETPNYEIVKTIGKVEIRKYPKMIVAQTILNDKTYENSANNGFRTIAGYIFGGNDANAKISMTVPVVMQMSDTARMYFVMPSRYTKEQLPKPNDANVQIVEESEKTLAVIRFGGYANDARIKEYSIKLQEILNSEQIKTKGSYMFMGYNAPWDLVHRRNEVAVEVQ